MNSVQNRMKKRRKAKEVLLEVINKASHNLVIHYSCESFYDIQDGRSPRITSIAIRYLETAQTKSFSIHKIAEKRHIKFQDIEMHYDELEKQMLDEFYEFVKEHRSYKWVHWNMRDGNYGFEAIENRYIVLNGTPERISDSNKIDLARLFPNLYGGTYIGHPRLEKLIEKNGITQKDFLAGAKEAEAFNNKEYVKLHQSTLRKVDILHTLVERTAAGSLKTNSSWRDIYGINPQGIFEAAKENWLMSIVFFVIGFLVKKALDYGVDVFVKK